MSTLGKPLSLEEAVASLEGLPHLLSAEQAGNALGLSTTTIRRRIREDKLRALKTAAGPGGRLRILKTDLARFLSELGR